MTLVERPVSGAATAESGGSGNVFQRLWRAPLWIHAAVLAVALLAILPLMSPLASYTSDEGAYALQAEALEDGHWEYEYRAAPYDPEGDHFPLVLSDRREDRYYAYAKHPAYPLLLRAMAAVFGMALGFHVLALLGVVMAASAAWLLAAEVDARASRPAFWLAAASPLLVNGYLLWAHVPSAALAGISLVAAVRVARRGIRTWASVALVAGLTAGVLLRSESLLFAGAVVAALVWVRLRGHGFRSAAVTAVAFGALPVLTAVLEARWVQAIVGKSGRPIRVRGDTEGSGYLAGRFLGAWHELFQAAWNNPKASTLGVITLFAVAGLGWLALRRNAPGWTGRLVFPCVIALVTIGLRLALAPREPVIGMFAAWPVALLGLLVVRWRSAPEPVRLLGIAGALYCAAIVATQYSGGGGLEWGGRFFSPAVPLIAVLAVLGLRDRIHAMPGSDRDYRTAFGALSAVVAAGAVFGLVSAGMQRAQFDGFVAAVARHPAEVTISVEPSLPRLGWRVDEDVTWMIAAEDEIVPLLARLHAAGVKRVTVLLPADYSLDDSPYPTVEVFDEPVIADLSGKLVRLSS